MKVYTLDAFTSTKGGGNPAGVVLQTEGLSEERMQSLAAKVGFSETAFIFPSDRADFRLRFFTPTEEVPLCGHATIAAFKLLCLQQKLTAEEVRQETGAGILRIHIREGLVRMEQALPTFGAILPKEEIANSLGLSAADLPEDLPLQIVSTGLSDIFIPLRSLSALKSFRPDFEKIREISAKYRVIGYHVFSLETLQGSTACCRNLAPLCGIDEEAATGTSNGALASYLFRHGVLRGKDLSALRFEQGFFMERPSEIFVSLTAEKDEITSVFVGGDAVLCETKDF